MELKENMLFRTKEGIIGKIDSFAEDKTEFYFDSKPIFNDGECIESKWGYTKDIIKTSFNIIDLIEEGDYVNGSKVLSVNVEGKFIIVDNQKTNTFFEKEIKTVVTKEEFEKREYKVC